MTKDLIWIVDDDRSIRWVLEKSFDKAGFVSESFESGDALLERLKITQPDAIISDIRMPGSDGLEVLEEVQETYPQVPVTGICSGRVSSCACRGTGVSPPETGRLRTRRTRAHGPRCAP